MKHTVKTILFIGLALIALFGMTGCPQNQSFGKPVDPALILRTDGYGKITGCKCAKEELPAALVIPAKIGNEEIKEIGSAAFAGYTGLTSLDLSGCTSLTTIGTGMTGRAFLNCTGLTGISLPASLTTIGQDAFLNCTGLTSAVFAVTDGWKAGGTSISSSDLANAEVAAKYLRQTYVYKFWRKS